jgi:hypothetical protein
LRPLRGLSRIADERGNRNEGHTLQQARRQSRSSSSEFPAFLLRL